MLVNFVASTFLFNYIYGWSFYGRKSAWFRKCERTLLCDGKFRASIHGILTILGFCDKP
jgi:hypothetical protein